jgi:uncharacterized protein YbjT (DUF2867 family)
MQVLIVGATGLIGSSIAARLLDEGHRVVGAGRSVASWERRMPGVRWLRLDLADTTEADDWLPHLTAIDAVVNCAGALQDGPADDTRAVHATGIAALFLACERAGVRRVVHFSAVGVDREAPTAFSRTKFEGDRVLVGRDLDWIILRPSVVVGRPAYGGSALFRGLAALPVLPVMPETGLLQVVQLDDVVETVSFFLEPGAPARVALELVGPDRLSFSDLIGRYRSWLGWPPARLLPLPGPLAGLSYCLGDLAGRLGWRPPVRSTARREIMRGAVGDPDGWTRLTGIRPRALTDALATTPPSVQERWFAMLYLLKPMIFVIFSAFWIVTGLQSLGPSYGTGIALMRECGAGALGAPTVVAGGLVDLAIGVGIAIRRTARPALYAALGVSIFYLVAGTMLLPRLWVEPLGPLLKIWPILALNLVALALLEDR